MSNYPAGVTTADIDHHFGELDDEPDAYGENYDDNEPEPEWRDHRGLTADDARDYDRALAAEEGNLRH